MRGTCKHSASLDRPSRRILNREQLFPSQIEPNRTFLFRKTFRVPQSPLNPAPVPNSPQPKMKEPMRSNLVYRAALKIENKFLLSTTVMQAVRKLHINSTRTEDTSNRVLIDVAEGRYAHGALPEIVPPPTIDTLLIVPAA